MSYATFVLSTGRCGTQWLAEQLKQHYGHELRVEHEPLRNDYLPRQMLGARRPQALAAPDAKRILAHMDGIERTLETLPYVECGHPIWSTLPYLLERLAGRIRIIHLVRHPVPTALSWLTHIAYMPPLLPYLPEKVLLSPFDDGVAFPAYRELWSALTPFEKCLYYWAEVNAFGLSLQQQTTAPWLRLRAEDLFSESGARQVQQFLGLPERTAMLVAGQVVVDRFRSMSPTDLPDLTRLAAHPAFVGVATALGYPVEWTDLDALYRRYLGFAAPTGQTGPT